MPTRCHVGAAGRGRRGEENGSASGRLQGAILVVGGVVMANPMFVNDERMVEMIFDYCRQRLALDPVPLDFGGARESFDAVLSGLIGESGNDPEAVLVVVRRSPGHRGDLL